MGNSSSRRARVLVAEDDRELRRLVTAVLRRCGYVVDEAANGIDMLERLADVTLRKRTFDLIVSDVRMPGLTGMEVIEGLQLGDRAQSFRTPVIFMTAFGDDDVHAEAARLGATILDKPFDLEDLGFYAVMLAPPREDDEALFRDPPGNGD